MSEQMTLAQFEDALDLHGAQLARWPAALRAPADELVALDADARRMLARSERVEALIGEALASETLPAPRLARITQGLARRRARALDPLFMLATPRSAIAALAATIIVFGLGAWTGSTYQETSNDQIELAMLEPAALDFYDAGLFGDP